jgi:phage-related protein
LETSFTFDKKPWVRYFEIRFLEEANEFLSSLDRKSAAKVVYNIDIAEQTNDLWLIKKLQDEIWEFRTKYAGKQIRLLAFWDKTNNQSTLVIATHGFIKKVDKVPAKEIERAENLRRRYFDNKQKK